MMDKEIIKKVALNCGLVEPTLTLFVQFFSLRFPNENNKITFYCWEWAQRFKQNDPSIYMDQRSLRIYESLLFKK